MGSPIRSEEDFSAILPNPHIGWLGNILYDYLDYFIIALGRIALSNKWDEALESITKLGNLETAKVYKLMALIELGRYEDAEKEFHPNAGPLDGFFCLQLCLGWHSKGRADRSGAWLAEAIKNYEKGTADDKMIATYLQKGEALNIADTQKVYLGSPAYKALFLAVLATNCPKEKEHLHTLARRLNYKLEHPHYFLETMLKS